MEYNFILVYEDNNKTKTYLGKTKEDIRDKIIALKKFDKHHTLGKIKMYYMTYSSIYGENF